MWRKWLFVIVVFLFLQCCHPERRIVSGHRAVAEKPYVVYLSRSEKSNNQDFNEWLCGGAIVTSRHILTSAACLEDITNLYAMAGYMKYVPTHLLDVDECTRNRKQKVVKTCVPKGYNKDNLNPAAWMAKDIGFAIVEKPYNFSDITYRIDCDYIPKPIRINLHQDPEAEQTNALVFGWGHTESLRITDDRANYNSEYLLEARTIIKGKKLCEDKFAKVGNLSQVIQKYMICCDDIGTLDGFGDEVPFAYGSRWYSCGEEFRRDGSADECGTHYETRRQYNTTSLGNMTRTPGICQNDHGSPLVSWYGSDEVLIGVATSSLLDYYYTCLPPYLYTSTFMNNRFILCVLKDDTILYNTTRRVCDELEEEGIEIKEVLWDTDNNVPSPKEINVRQEIKEPNKTTAFDSKFIRAMAASKSSSLSKSTVLSSTMPKTSLESSSMLLSSLKPSTVSISSLKKTLASLSSLKKTPMPFTSIKASSLPLPSSQPSSTPLLSMLVPFLSSRPPEPSSKPSEPVP